VTNPVGGPTDGAEVPHGDEDRIMQSRSKGQLKQSKREGERAPSVVLVDDDRKVIELLQIALSSCGYKTSTASDGEEAVEVVEKADPDVVVLDVRLPKRNGYQVCEALKSNPKTRGIPIIMISGLVEPSARVQGLRCGAEDYLTKPFSPKELILRIQKILLRVSEKRSRAKLSAELERELMDREKRLGLAQRKLEKRVERMAGLTEMGRRMAGATSLEELSDRLMLSLQVCLRVSRAMVALRERGQDEFHPMKHHGISRRRVHGLTIPADGRLCERLASEGRVLTVDELDSAPGIREELLQVTAAGLSMGVLVDGVDGPAAMVFVGGDLHGNGFGVEQRDDLKTLAGFFRTGLISLQRAEKDRARLLDSVEGVVNLLECDTTGRRGHSKRVARYAQSIADALSMCPRDKQEIRLAALLHEVKGAAAPIQRPSACPHASGGECARSDAGTRCVEGTCDCSDSHVGPHRGEERSRREGCDNHGESGSACIGNATACPGGESPCSRDGGRCQGEDTTCSAGGGGEASRPESASSSDGRHRMHCRLIVRNGGSSSFGGTSVSLSRHGRSGVEPILGAGSSPFPPEVASVLSHVRERYDGKGVPLGLSGEDIPLPARILAVADTFDDCLRHGWSLSPVDQAIRSLRGLSGTNLDPNIVEVLVHHILSGEIMLG